MTYLRRLGLGLILALCLARPAAADPVTAVIASVKAFAAASAVNAFIVRLAVSFALSALSVAIKGKPDTPRQPGIKTDTTTSGGTNPQAFILGRYATAGNLAAPPMSHPNDGETPNEFLTYVVDVSDVPGVTLNRLIVGEDYLDDLAAQGPAGEAVPAGFDLAGKWIGGVPHVMVTFHDGHQTAADGYLLSTYGSYPDRPWTADMVGTGLAYAVVMFRYNREVFNNLPALRFEVDGIALYDPRADSTVGGTGAHRWADPATWAPSDNPAVMIYNILRGVTLPDGRHWGGSVPAADLPLDRWLAAMNECDQVVPLMDGGTEPQYCGGFEVSLDMTPAAVIEELAKACSGEVAEVGGVYTLRVGPPALPSFFITDADLSADDPERLMPYPGLDGVHNAIHASHPAPAALWETRDAPPLYNPAWEAEDQGRQLVAAVDLPAVASDTQVQRLMAAWIKDERRFRRHTLALPPEAAVLEPLDTLAWTSDRHGYAGKVFEVGEIGDDLATCFQTLTVRERDGADFAWVPETDEIAVFHPSPARALQLPRSLAGWAVAGVAIADAAGAARRPGLALSWTGTEMIDALAVEFQVRPQGQAALAAQGTVTDVLGGSVIVSEGILPGVAYEARGRVVMAARAAVWTAWTPAAAPDHRLGAADFSDGFNAQFAAAEAALAEARADLDFTIPKLADLDRAIGDALEFVLGAQITLEGLGRQMAEAGVYVDPATGSVRIAGVVALEDRQGRAEVTVDALAAQVALSASQLYVNEQISLAVLEPSQIPILDDFQLSLTDLDLRLDAAEGTITSLAGNLTVDGQVVTMVEVRSELDAINGTLTQKLDTATFDAVNVSARLNAAEVAIDTLDGANITFTVEATRRQYREIGDGGAQDLAGLLRGFLEGEAIREGSAAAQRQIASRVTEDFLAEAEARAALRADLGTAEAAIVSEQTARASADSALAQDITALEAGLDTAEAAIVTLDQVKVDAAGAVAAATQEISASYGDLSGLAAATLYSEANVDNILAGIQWRARAGGVAGEVELTSNGVTAQFQVSADRFKFVGDVAEFFSDVRITGDLIQGGTIERGYDRFLNLLGFATELNGTGPGTGNVSTFDVDFLAVSGFSGGVTALVEFLGTPRDANKIRLRFEVSARDAGQTAYVLVGSSTVHFPAGFDGQSVPITSTRMELGAGPTGRENWDRIKIEYYLEAIPGEAHCTLLNLYTVNEKVIQRVGNQ